ncbi:MAG TPA: peptide chain release factor 2 [Candidatus Marinimicrobia bacterium]|nr:peptide chain release factor 2 [Candidatus Neomarinimicrobiota bacterium]MDP7120969.1 peptide chain release factor 2 [Candidatus Neomarinimicrobiota bacterium]MDP7483893.1 peptide chain release factor 2 [Candidatus Neomarinimicrobiota bacterium]MDP7527863.1 peptide chain release factor 2 [Candidatus Neomarinimicrobiota bacterium]MDP7716734.1 peptide chain release factor 2 [Candidatus Neomarinimicrobiota bacterium]
MDLSELKEKFQTLDKRFNNLRGYLDLTSFEDKLSQLRAQTVAGDFWDNTSSAQTILKKISMIEKELELWNGAQRKKDDCEVLLTFLEEEEDSASQNEFQSELDELQKTVDDLELRLILSGTEDANDAILTIHPGAGGTESQDWAEMLYRMYVRWIERKGFSYSIIDFQPGDEAGLKDVTLEVKGEYAYGLLKAEVGVHRLVRISPFDASNRRHTSFASIFVYPSIDEEIEVEVKPDELRIDTYRASGAGGQHVNKTDSAVRITHIPTKIVVQCQNERSQHKNKATAMKILKAKLYQKYVEEQAESIKELESQKTDIGWGSQIRSYVFHPYIMVKDHRTKLEVGDGKRVMDGDLDELIKTYLLMVATDKTKVKMAES